MTSTNNWLIHSFNKHMRHSTRHWRYYGGQERQDLYLHAAYVLVILKLKKIFKLSKKPSVTDTFWQTDAATWKQFPLIEHSIFETVLITISQNNFHPLMIVLFSRVIKNKSLFHRTTLYRFKDSYPASLNFVS